MHMFSNGGFETDREARLFALTTLLRTLATQRDAAASPASTPAPPLRRPKLSCHVRLALPLTLLSDTFLILVTGESSGSWFTFRLA